MGKKKQSTIIHPTELVVDGKYRLIRKIGSGSFGEVYLAKNTRDGKEVAVKIESANARYPKLQFEAKVYSVLNRGVGIPRMHYYGTVRNYNALVIDLLGPSLDDLFDDCMHRFTMKTVLMLIDQMLVRIEFMHLNGYIHRDIKPCNFLMGTGPQSKKLFIIDFGLSKQYRERSGKHIPYRENTPMVGTVRFASINSHLGREQSRRDDMEALGYVIMYFIRGTLPWQGLRAKNSSQRTEKIKEVKLSTPVSVLCQGFPPQFAAYLNYCRKLSFDQRPDYVFLRRNFRTLFTSLDHQLDFVYDWVRLHQGQPVASIAYSENRDEREETREDLQNNEGVRED